MSSSKIYSHHELVKKLLDYDITFSAGTDAYKRGCPQGCYENLAMLLKDTEKPVVFRGGKDYIPLFCSLTEGVRSRRTVFYNSDTEPNARGCELRRFRIKARTNWDCECSKQLARADVVID